MSEQLTLDIEVPEISEEERFYNTYLLASFLKCIEREAAEAKFLSFKKGANFSSVFFGSVLVLRLCLRGKRWYASVPRSLAQYYPDRELKYGKLDRDFIRVYFKKEEEAIIAGPLSYSLEEALQKYPRDSGCCSHYMDCSDALRCVQTDPLISMACIYRQNLKAGRVFYGKNKNI